MRTQTPSGWSGYQNWRLHWRPGRSFFEELQPKKKLVAATKYSLRRNGWLWAAAELGARFATEKLSAVITGCTTGKEAFTCELPMRNGVMGAFTGHKPAALSELS